MTPTRIFQATRARTIAGLAIAVTGIAFIVWVALENSREEARRRACANVMKQIGLAMFTYKNENPRELYPSLSAEPGLLAFDANTRAQLLAKGERFQTAHMAEDSRKQFQDMNWSPETVPNNAFTDKEYFYLGYAVADDRDVEKFARAYRESILAGRPLNEDFINPNEPDQVKRVMLWRLREGIERAFYERFDVGMGNPGGSSMSQRRLPILIERPGHHNQPGGHVLYLDGHVEFIDYAGKWPMTEKTIGILNELDALGSKPNR